MSDIARTVPEQTESSTVSLTARDNDGVRRLTRNVFRATACPAHPLSQEAKDALGTFTLTGQNQRCLVEQRVDPDTHETTATLDLTIVPTLDLTLNVCGVACSLVPLTGCAGFELVRVYTEDNLSAKSSLMLLQTKDAVGVQLFCLRAGTECPEELDVVVKRDGNDAKVVLVKPSTVTVVGSSGGGEDKDDQTVVCSRVIGGVAGLSGGASSLHWTPFGQCAKARNGHRQEDKIPDTDHVWVSALDLIVNCRYDLELMSWATDVLNGYLALRSAGQWPLNYEATSMSSQVHAVLQQASAALYIVLNRVDVAPEDTDIYLNARTFLNKVLGK
jgi:hypothetical protein